MRLSGKFADCEEVESGSARVLKGLLRYLGNSRSIHNHRK